MYAPLPVCTSVRVYKVKAAGEPKPTLVFQTKVLLELKKAALFGIHEGIVFQSSDFVVVDVAVTLILYVGAYSHTHAMAYM